MSPVLKWAGGKSQLLDFISANMPESYGRYYEPFVGAGALWLAMAPKHATVNDANGQLINLYLQLKEDPQQVVSRLKELDWTPCDKAFYRAMRDLYNSKVESGAMDAEGAALMIWLNKHCFNGLYRVNGKGLFNVPYNGRTVAKSFDERNFTRISSYLRENDVLVTCGDFENACRDVRPGDFVYFDSPYVPAGPTANFTAYAKSGFTSADHERLAALFHRLNRIGAKLMLSNNDVPTVRELYRDYEIRSIEVGRMINRDASKRTGKEILVTNY